MWRNVLLILPVMLFMTLTASAQAPVFTGSLTGHVLDSAGKPVIGATVRLMGTTQGGVSKAPDGKFMIQNIRVGVYKIRVTAVGYKPVEYEVQIEADRTASITAQFAEAIALIDDFPVASPDDINPERSGTTSIITAEELSRMP